MYTPTLKSLAKDTIKSMGGTIKDKAWEKEEWGGWKIVSDMLDHPDENGIYSTSVCYQKLYDFVVAQKKKAIASAVEARDNYWMSQNANEHDNAIREAYRVRISAEVESMSGIVFPGGGRHIVLDKNSVLSIINPSKE